MNSGLQYDPTTDPETLQLLNIEKDDDTMKIECHIIQNFPPNCLNRDDTNSPKDCEFGGVRRARISSQCFKRAVRDAFEEHQTFPAEMRAVRTKRVIEQVVDILGAKGRARQDATSVVVALLEQVSLKVAATDKDTPADKMKYLLFLPQRKLEELAAVAEEYWDALLAATCAESDSDEPVPAEPQAESKGRGKTKPKPKQKSSVELPKEVKSRVNSLMADAKKTPEIALFGRMIADNPAWNVEASCQVAQALSTHRVSMEFDFFTAVDDLKKESDTGSDMMGTVQFNSACLYRYAVIDVDALLSNLGGKEQADLCLPAVSAFLSAFVHARPTGKQNSMAAHTLPSLVLITVRDSGEPLSMANAFVKPIVVRDTEKGLDQLSIERLLLHFASSTRMYPGGIRAVHVCKLDEIESDISTVGFTPETNVPDLIANVCKHVGVGTRAA